MPSDAFVLNVTDDVVPVEFRAAGDLISNLLNGLLSSFKPNIRNINHELLKDGISRVIDSVKPMIPGSLDDLLFDSAKVAIHTMIDGWKNAPPVVVGAVSESGVPLTTQEMANEWAISAAKKARLRSQEEVEAMITAEGGNPKQFAPWLLLLLQYLPAALELIKKLLNK